VTVYGDGSQSRDFTYVANVVEANLAAAEAPTAAGTVLNVATGGSETVDHLADTVGRLLRLPVEKRYEPARPGDVEQSWADISAAATILDYMPTVEFEEGLRRTIAALLGDR
jgi:UDP-glucose 4-epimerase